jgi:hypothetical protein
MTTHIPDDDLVLHYYGEDNSPEPHLAACADCAGRYRELASILQAVPVEVPERGDHYGLEVWHQIRHRLPERAPFWQFLGRPLWGLAAAAAAVVLLVSGFAAGRLWPPDRGQGTAVAVTAPAATEEQARRRLVLLTVADHLDRSHRVLADIMNAPGQLDISAEQQWAGDLVAASRLYRQDAIAIEETSIAAVLEEIERALLDIIHQPASATAADLDDIRRRIDSAALLFKVRVLTTDLQQRLEDAPAAPTTRSTSTIG